jgi:hypothetical protein
MLTLSGRRSIRKLLQMGYLPQLGVLLDPTTFRRVPGPNRYILLASVSPQTLSILTDLLNRAGVVDPLVTVRTDNEAVATMHQPDREPPVAVFVDLPGLRDATRLIGWIVSSPTTRLIPVFAITGPGAPDRAEVEAYKPTAIIPHPLSLEDVSKCVELSPLLRGAKRASQTPPANSGRPPFSLMLTL